MAKASGILHPSQLMADMWPLLVLPATSLQETLIVGVMLSFTTRNTGMTSRVSLHTDGTQGLLGSSTNPSLSADGRYVVFVSFANNLVAGDTNGSTDIFVHDRNTGMTTRVSLHTDGTQGLFGYSSNPSLSADGRYVVFESTSNTLVTGDTNGTPDIFVHDRNTSTTTRVSVHTDGTQGSGESTTPSISADGRLRGLY